MDFVNRLKFFMDRHGIAISQFADTCRIPRPTLSQILNGRNKKISDELISKIHQAYPTLNVLWLMFGEGEMEPVANMQFSEAQNAPQEGAQAPYGADSQSGMLPFDGENPVTDSDAEKSQGQVSSLDSLFSASAADSAEYPGGATAPSAQGNGPAATPGNDAAPGAYGQVSPADAPDGSMAAETEDPAPYGRICFYNEVPDRPMRAPEPSRFGASDSRPGAAAAQRPAAGQGAESPETSAGHEATSRATVPLTGGGSISLDSPGDKKITNIVVFYSDNSFQSFSPTA